jgi:hypothetical protein
MLLVLVLPSVMVHTASILLPEELYFSSQEQEHVKSNSNVKVKNENENENENVGEDVTMISTALVGSVNGTRRLTKAESSLVDATVVSILTATATGTGTGNATSDISQLPEYELVRRLTQTMVSTLPI